MQYKFFSLLMTVSILSNTNVFGQNNKFYIKLYGGYGLFTPGSFHTIAYSNYPQFQEQSGLGKGLHYGGGIGVSVNEFLSIGVDCDYLDGVKVSGQETRSSSFNINATTTTTNTFITKKEMLHNVLSVIPNLTFKALSRPSYYFYTRLGVIISAKTKLVMSESDSSNGKTVYPNYTATGTMAGHQINEYKFKTDLGFQIAFGIQAKLSEHIKFFTELEGFFLPTYPDSYTKTNTYYTQNAQSNSATQTTKYYKIISNYKFLKEGQSNPGTGDSFSGSGNSADDPIKSTSNYNTVKEVYNINHIGLSLGFAFRF